MSKVSDGFRLDVMQSGIYQQIDETHTIRARIDSVRREITGKFIQSKAP